MKRIRMTTLRTDERQNLETFKLIKMQYRTFKQTTYQGQERTIYEAKVGTATIQTDSLEKLKTMINEHVEIKQGTFKL